MHILYLDHSGDPDDPNQRHVVLAGVSVFERQTHWLSREMDEIAQRFNPGDPASVEIHASPMRSGRGFWRNFPKEDRLRALADCCGILVRSIWSTVLFGAVVEKVAISPTDPIDFTFEQICSRFDWHLKRLHKAKNTQRGMIVFDKASYEDTVQNLAIDFKNIGRSWGVTLNLAEVPVFIDSRASRLVQLADVVAFALFRHYEYNDSTLFNIIHPRFDKQGAVVHGLVNRLVSPPPFNLEP